MIQMMLVGIKLIKCFMTTGSLLITRRQGLQTLEIPIAKLQARHNCSEAKKKYPQEANVLHSCL